MIKKLHNLTNLKSEKIYVFLYFLIFLFIGLSIFDDYGIFKVDGILKSIKKIISKNYDRKYHIIYNYMGQCIMIKK